MKKTLLLCLLLAAVVCGCKKYEEGPLISFRSAQTRLWGVWEVTEYTSDGIDSLQSYKDTCGCNIVFSNPADDTQRWSIGFSNCNSSDREFMYGYQFKNKEKIIGIWRFAQSSSYYNVKSFGPILVLTEWEILRLTNKEFKFSATVNNHYYEVALKKTSQ